MGFPVIMRKMRRILIISPDPETARMLDLRFDLDGYTVETTLDMKEARNVARRNPYHVFLLDMIETDRSQMKEVQELAKYARANRGIQTIVLLPRGQRDLKLKKPGWKPDLIIKKPYELGQLVASLSCLVIRDS